MFERLKIPGRRHATQAQTMERGNSVVFLATLPPKSAAAAVQPRVDELDFSVTGATFLSRPPRIFRPQNNCLKST